MVGLVAAAVAAFAFARPPMRSTAHPLHTTVADLTIDRPRRVIRATIRMFEDDLAAAASRGGPPAAGRPGDAQVTGYVIRGFSFTSGNGRAAARSCGIRRSGDLAWVCIEATLPDAAQIWLADTLLCELYNDQINIVQVAGAGGVRSLLFTKGEAPKRLP